MICSTLPQSGGLGQILYTFVLFPCGYSTADVPFPFVLIKYLAYLLIEHRVIMFETLGNVFMYCGFGDMVVFCGGADCCSGFNHVHSQFAGSFLQRF